MAIEQQLTELGYTQVDAQSWELKISDDLAWLVESDIIGHSLSEWTGIMWRRVAVYFDADLLVTTLEAQCR